MAIKGPYFGNFYKMGLQDKPSNVKFRMSIPGQIDYDSGRANLKDHMRTMFLP